MSEQISVSDLFKNRILWKVYLVWLLKRIVPLIILEVALLTLAAMLFADSVFVSRVLRNVGVTSSSGYFDIFLFLLAAFLNTGFLVKLAVLVSLGLGALLLRDAVRSLLTYKSMWIKK